MGRVRLWTGSHDKNVPAFSGKYPVKPKIRRSKRRSSQPLPMSQYAAYMMSPEWATMRAAYWRLQPRRACKSCGATRALQVHHHTYARLGVERLADLVGLCASCHTKVHALARSRPWLSLTEATEQATGLRLWGRTSGR